MRVKTGTVRKRRHNKFLKSASGFRGRRKSCYPFAKRAVGRAQRFAYRDRKNRKRDFRALWILRIGAAARAAGISYSRLVRGLKAARIALDRKILAQLAVNDPAAFGLIVERAKGALSA